MTKLNLSSFPYRISSEGKYFPVIPISINYQKKKKEIFVLIDSGATVSIFRSEVAEEFGVEIEKGETIYLHGVGGRIKGYLHRLKIEVAGKKFICPIIFSDEYLVSFNLLGREAFFEKFKIIFEESKRKITLT